MKKLLVFLCTISLLLGAVNTAKAGKIVLANDEWTLSNTGFANASNTGIFATNFASWFTGGLAGDFLVYSNNFGLTENSLASTMTTEGHTWNIDSGLSTSFDLATLSAYDGIFLAGNAADTDVLTDYVNAGGNVYLAGGTGWGGAAAEAARWNPFLNDFGLAFADFYNYGIGGAGNYPINSGHPIFDGVNYLYNHDGNDTLDILVTDPRSEVLVNYQGHGLYAVYDSAPVPEPATMILLGTGLVGLVGFGRKKFFKMR